LQIKFEAEFYKIYATRDHAASVKIHKVIQEF